jgi:hypothetical protein
MRSIRKDLRDVLNVRVQCPTCEEHTRAEQSVGIGILTP